MLYKRFKKPVSLILCIMFMLAIMFLSDNGRPKNNIEAKNSANYNERVLNINAEGEVFASAKLNSKDQLVVLTMYRDFFNFLIINSNGAQIAKINSKIKSQSAVFTLDTKDNIYILEETNAKAGNTIHVYDPKGKKLKEINLRIDTATKGEDDYITDMALDSKGVIYLLTNHRNIIVINQNSRITKDWGLSGINSIEIDKSDNLIVSGSAAESGAPFLKKINTVTGAIVWNLELGMTESLRLLTYYGPDDSIYDLDQRGIKKYDTRGKDLGYVLDFKEAQLFGFDSYILSMNIDRKRNVFLTVVEGDDSKGLDKLSSKLVKYSLENNNKQERTSTKNQKLLTISALESSDFLETAISEFQKQNPNIKVNLKTCSSLKTMGDYDRYISALNTELMSGKGADLIAVDSIPYRKYLSKNVFANLSEIISQDQDFDFADYNTSIIDAFKYHGNLYFMPVTIDLVMIAANRTILNELKVNIDDTKWTWEDFISLAEKIAQYKNSGTQVCFALPQMDGLRLFGYIFSNNNYHEFIDFEKKKCYFNESEFIKVLNLCKTLTGKKVMNPKGPINTFSPETFDMFDRGSVVFIPNRIFSYSDFGSYNKDAIFYQIPSFGETHRPLFSARLMFAVNKNSKVKNEAWQFIKYLISEETQIPPQLGGFVINKAAEKIRFQDVFENTHAGRYMWGNKKILPVKQEYYDLVAKVTASLGERDASDDQIDKILRKEVTAFLNGQISAAETARNIQNKVETYLNE